MYPTLGAFVTDPLKGRAEFRLTADIQRELSRDAPIQTRTRAIRELSEAVLKHRLEDVSVRSKLCYKNVPLLVYINFMEDMGTKNMPKGNRFFCLRTLLPKKSFALSNTQLYKYFGCPL